MSKKLLVCGSRDFDDYGLMWEWLTGLCTRGDIIVHGDQRGADKIAGEVAKQLGLEVREYPADWKKYGNKAGPIRNQLMLDLEHPVRVLAFPMGGPGTRDMIFRAKKIGLSVIIGNRENVFFKEGK